MPRFSFLLKCLCLLCALWLSPVSGHAQEAEDKANAAYKTSADHVTDPPVRLTPDKSELIRLDEDAEVVIVGNPAHASVLTENKRLLVVVPQLPGATHFTVLGDEGKVIMQRHVIVATPKERYLRVRRNCLGVASPSGSAVPDDCRTTRVYYCDGMCHEIAVPEEDGEGGEQDAAGEAAQNAETENVLTGNN